jgi:hypothetical protein
MCWYVAASARCTSHFWSGLACVACPDICSLSRNARAPRRFCSCTLSQQCATLAKLRVLAQLLGRPFLERKHWLGGHLCKYADRQRPFCSENDRALGVLVVILILCFPRRQVHADIQSVPRYCLRHALRGQWRQLPMHNHPGHHLVPVQGGLLPKLQWRVRRSVRVTQARHQACCIASMC